MTQKEWTIMIYMAGDNNLAVDMAYAMEQIKGIATESADSPNLFVYYDGNSPAIPTLYCDFSDPRKPRYVRSYDVPNKRYPALAKHNENAADKRSILNFIDWCVNGVPVGNNGQITYGRRAQKYALIFSGHSLGFQDIGLFKDESTGKALTMKDLYTALVGVTITKEEFEELARKDGVEDEEELASLTQEQLGQPLDILGFDSCVMGMLEVGYQFSDVAKTMIASEGSVPSAGWTYAKILGSLGREQNRDLDPCRVAELFVKEFIRSQDSYTVGGVSVDMAAWDLSQFEALVEAFDALSEVLLRCFKKPESRIYRQMRRVLLAVRWQCQSYMFDQNVDLGDFCELLKRECGLVAEELGDDSKDVKLLNEIQYVCQWVLDELQKAVILSGFSGGGYQYSNGISVFFPWSREGYEVSRKNYESLEFTQQAVKKRLAWPGFLKKYLREVSLRKCEPTNPDVPVGSKVRYPSGVPLDDAYAAVFAGGNGSLSTKISGQEGTKISGQEGTKISGQEGTKISGQEGTKISGQEGTKISGQEGTKISGQEGTKISGQEGTKISGQEGTKISGQEGTKISGQEGTKISGQEGTKISGQEGTKISGQEGTKISGQEGTKISGQEGTKISGQEGTKISGQEGTKISGQEGTKISGQEGTKLAGGGANAFFTSLRMFKNVESRWDISGFTKKPEEAETAEVEPAKQAKA